MKRARLVSAAQSSRGSDTSEMYTLSRAKAHLGRLLEKSERGATVYILKGHKRFLLQPVHEIEPIPSRPPGYFKFEAADVRLDAQFAKANVVPTPDRE